jgi:hypothetical protein
LVQIHHDNNSFNGTCCEKKPTTNSFISEKNVWATQYIRGILTVLVIQQIIYIFVELVKICLFVPETELWPPSQIWPTQEIEPAGSNHIKEIWNLPYLAGLLIYNFIKHVDWTLIFCQT